jgi:hypothetical protein
VPWVKVDDRFDEHPKHAAVGPVGWGVWLAGLAYANRNLTDGFIPYAIAEGIGGQWRIREPIEDDQELDNGVRETRGRQRVWTIDIGSGFHGESITSEWVIGHLVRVGLWDEVEGGYRIHDYSEYQPSKADVLEERRKAADRQSQARSRRKSRPKSRRDSVRTDSVSPPAPVPVPQHLKDAEGYGGESASETNGSHLTDEERRANLDRIKAMLDERGLLPSKETADATMSATRNEDAE